MNNFECKYSSIGGTFCFCYDSQIGLNGTECNSCELNNNCGNCIWETVNPEKCADCE